MNASDRYSDRPFLRFLDSYVLEAIGQLDDDQREALVQMTPKLATALGHSGSWQRIVEAQMEFPDSLPTQIRAVWERYLDTSKQAGRSVDPNEFVQEFVDQNFPGS